MIVVEPRYQPRPDLPTGRARIRGVLPVFQTPFHPDESIDFETLEREITWLFDRGSQGVVMAIGSETLRLASEEREALAETVCRCAVPRGVAVISVGAESSHAAERYARHAQAAGADAVMAIPPVSTPASESQLRSYYERILGAVELPVIIQDASGYVGRPMSTELQAGLFNQYGDRVMFKPEAVPIGPLLSGLRDATGGRAAVFEGTGGIALVDSFRRGIVGTMPGADLIDAIVALWRALEEGDDARVYNISPLVASLISMQHSLDAFLAVEKHLLVKQGVFKNTVVREPVGYVLDEETRKEADRLFERLTAAVDSPVRKCA